MDWSSVVKIHPQSVMLAALLGVASVAAPAVAQSSGRALPPATAPIAVDNSYLLGPGDRVKIDIFGVTEYSGEYQVTSDGAVNLPLAGNVSVQNRTLTGAADAIKRRYSEYLTRPVITVSLLTARPIQVAVSGEVARPGTYTTALNDVGVPTLSRMVQMAGGIKQSADLKRIQIRRAGQPGRSVDLAQLLRTGDLSQDVRLRDGDSVFIPAATALNFQDANQLASSSLGASFDRPINIVIAGEVNRPGPQTVRGDTIAVQNTDPTATPGQPNVTQKVKAPTVTRALQSAQGITQRANIRDIEVKRTVADGTEQTIKVNLLSLLQAGDAKQDIVLQEGDRVIVPAATTMNAEEASLAARASFSPDVITVNVVGEVEKPGAIQLSPNTTMNQAILAAGGFNGKARKGEVTFLRLQPNGAVDRRKIPVDFNRGIDMAKNPPLQSGDTIVIGKTGFATFTDGLGSILGPALGIFGVFR